MSQLENIPDPQFEKYMKFVTKLLDNYDIDPSYMDFTSDFLPSIQDIEQKVFGPVGIRNVGVPDIEYLYIYLTTGNRPSLNTYNVITYEDYWVKQRYFYTNDIDSYFGPDEFTQDHVSQLMSDGVDGYEDMYDNFDESEELDGTDYIDGGVWDIR